MKILGISGGSKNGSNDAMVKEALMGAKEQGAEIEFINLFDLDLKACTGCIACIGGKNGLMQGGNGDCIYKDDMDWLAERIFAADGIIWGVPVFECGIPAILHVVEDKLFGPTHDPGLLTVAKKIAQDKGAKGPDERKFAKKVMSYIAVGGSDWNSRVSAAMNTFSMSPIWPMVDEVIFEFAKAVLKDDAAIARAHELGVNTAKAAADPANAKYVGPDGMCGVCHSNNFYFRPGGVVECEVCGCRGKIVPDGEGYKFEYGPDQLELVHTDMPGKFHHMDDIYKGETELMEYKKTDEYKQRKAKYADFIQGSKPE